MIDTTPFPSRSFSYRDYRTNEVTVITASSLDAADLMFETIHGTHPIKMNWVGVTWPRLNGN
jgi:hypothetical protein